MIKKDAVIEGAIKGIVASFKLDDLFEKKLKTFNEIKAWVEGFASRITRNNSEGARAKEILENECYQLSLAIGLVKMKGISIFEDATP